MLDSIHIQNCHSHKDTFVEFHKGVNVIVGETDAGKSALMRALRYSIWNDQSSKSLLSHWGGVVSVAVTTDGHKITRKSDTKEIYLLDDLPFHSFGTKVPAEVQKVFNMDSEINSQEQIETFFLLTETPGYVASFLNKIANLEQIDSVTKSIKSELHEKSRLIEHQKEDVKKKEKELEAFTFLPDFKVNIEFAEDLKLQCTDTKIMVEFLNNTIHQIKKWNGKIEESEKLSTLKPTVDAAIDLLKQKDELNASKQKLVWFDDLINDLDNEIADLSSLLQVKALINEALKLKSKQNDLQAKLDSINAISSKISTINKKIEISQSEIDKERNLYETELHKLNKCFFCGSKLNKK